MIKYKYEIGHLINVSGGQLTYLGKTDMKYDGHVLSLWKCFCDQKFKALNRNIVIGNTKSCGCWKEKILEDKLKDPNNIYLKSIWNAIKQRCYNKNNISYKNYGGRGIILTNLWENNSEKFISDILTTLGHRPTDKHQLDRINNNGNYEINNVRWVTFTENQRNKRNNTFITINNETKTLAEWSEISGISLGTILRRYKNKWIEGKLLNPIKIITKLKINPPLYSRWRCIKTRCCNDKVYNYKYYGERGIKIFDLWKNDYKKFEEDIIKEIGLPPTKKHQLDRINNNGNYELGNIRWVSFIENQNNKRNNRLLTINNEIKTISEWCRITNVSRGTLIARVNHGWKEENLLEPIIKRKFDLNQAEEIRKKYNEENISLRNLSKCYGVGINLILDIIHKRGAYSK